MREMFEGEEKEEEMKMKMKKNMINKRAAR